MFLKHKAADCFLIVAMNLPDSRQLFNALKKILTFVYEIHSWHVPHVTTQPLTLSHITQSGNNIFTIAITTSTCVYTRQNIFNTYHFLQQDLSLHSRIRRCCAKCFRRFLAKPRFQRLIRLVTSSQIRELPYKNNNSLLSKHKIT